MARLGRLRLASGYPAPWVIQLWPAKVRRRSMRFPRCPLHRVLTWRRLCRCCLWCLRPQQLRLRQVRCLDSARSCCRGWALAIRRRVVRDRMASVVRWPGLCWA